MRRAWFPGMTRPGPMAPLLILTAACTWALLPACGHDSGDHPPTDDEIGFVHRAVSCPHGGRVKPATPLFSSSIDDYAGYAPQTRCSGSAKPGVKAFRDLVLKTYPCTSSGGIVRGCSAGGRSEHKEGRAWDWMVSYPHPAAAELLEWLLATDEHGNQAAMARRLGIMYMIWNRKIWKSYQAHRGWQKYNKSAHRDHVHFSFSWAAAKKQTSFWSAQCPAQGCPGGCEPLDSTGGIIDETSPCIELHGKSQYWRAVEGQGWGGSLLWTNAYQSSAPSNWARWRIKLQQAGRYRVEYHADDDYSVYDAARYQVRHDGQTSEVIVDLSTALSGWYELGVFEFAVTGDQHVSLYDNYSGSVASSQHIAIDAVRLTLVDSNGDPVPLIAEGEIIDDDELPNEPDEDPAPAPERALAAPFVEPAPQEAPRASGGCSIGSPSGVTPAWPLLPALLLLGLLARPLPPPLECEGRRDVSSRRPSHPLLVLLSPHDRSGHGRGSSARGLQGVDRVSEARPAQRSAGR